MQPSIVFLKTAILSLCFCFFYFTSTCQNNLSLRPGFSAEIQVINQNFKSTSLYNEMSLGTSASFDLFYEVNDRLTLSSGLSYHFISAKQIDYSVTFDCPLGNNDPYHSWLEDQFDLSYLGIPIGLRYHLSKRGNWFVTIGLEGIMKTGEKRQSYVVECGEDSKIPTGRSLLGKPEKVVFLGTAGIAYQFDFLRDRLLSIGPSFGYFLGQVFDGKSTISEGTDDSNIFCAGIRLGIQI